MDWNLDAKQKIAAFVLVLLVIGSIVAGIYAIKQSAADAEQRRQMWAESEAH